MYINGEFSAAADGRRMDIVNPADRSIVGSVADASADDATRAVHAARAAFPGWKGLTGKERSVVLQRSFGLLAERVDDIAKLVTLENGKPFAEAQREVIFANEYVKWFAEEARRVGGELISSPTQGRRFLVLKQPIGVVAAITPWNFPATMITRKIAPALAAGCTVVLKPAPETPLSALAIARAFHDAGLPPGVLNVVTSSRAPEIGEVFFASRDVRKLCFTGSTQTGKLLMRGAAATVKHVAFELGGNAPFIVFEDAALEAAVRDAITIKYLRVGGQSCICANRFFVHESIAPAFEKSFVAAARQLKLATGFTPGAQVGPLINERALEKVEALVNEAVRDGAHLLLGGQRAKGSAYDAGYFYEPTVLSGVTDTMRVVEEEAFGPVAPILTFRTESEVVARANATNLGLAAYVHTRDMGRMFRLMDSLECGLLGFNDAGGYSHEVPFGGVKESGLGREGGVAGIEAYLEQKTVVLGLPTI